MNEHHGSLSRRNLVKASAATVAFGGLAQSEVGAQSPDAAAGIDLQELETVSAALVGGGNINGDAVPILSSLVSADPALAAAFPELAAITEFTSEAVAALSEPARNLATNMLQFWYLGQWDGAATEQRADVFFSLVSWQALPYTTHPTLCKSFGYWSMDVLA